MNLFDYIKVSTRIDAAQKDDDVEWSLLPPSKLVILPKKRHLPYHLEIEKALYDTSTMEEFEEIEIQNDASQFNESNLEYAEIRSSVREIGLGWNIYNVLEKRYRESQQKYFTEKSSSESEFSYATATDTLTDDSYLTALEDFERLRRPSEDVGSEISIDSSIDKSRYKKNALISKLLENVESEISNFKQVPINNSVDECDTSDSLNDVINRDEIQNNNNNEKKWNDDTIENQMYQDRVLRLFQSKEDEDVYVHPLRELIQEDPVWKDFHLSRKGVEVIETARSYYMNLPEEQFVYERVTKEKSKKKKVRKYRPGFN